MAEAALRLVEFWTQSVELIDAHISQAGLAEVVSRDSRHGTPVFVFTWAEHPVP